MSLIAWAALAVLLLAAVPTAVAAWRLAPFLPTPHRAVDAALTLAGVGSGDVVVDLGAGDGRVLRAAVARGARAVGFELSPVLWLLAVLRLLPVRGRARVVLGDALRADLTGATVVFVFATARTAPRVAQYLATALTPGTRVLSYVFPLSGWTPAQVAQPRACGPIVLYRVPTS